VWTNDKREEDRFIAGIEAGMTAVNQMLASMPEARSAGSSARGMAASWGRGVCTSS